MMTKTANKSRLPRTGTLVLLAVVLLVCGGALMVWVPYHRNQVVIAEVENLVEIQDQISFVLFGFPMQWMMSICGYLQGCTKLI